MKARTREGLIFLEALALAGPVTAFVVYSSILAVVYGVPTLGWSLGAPGRFDPFLAVVLCALPLGAFSLVHLWSLTRSTAKGHRHSFGRTFRLAVVSAIISSAALVSVLGLAALLLGVAAPCILLAHMAYLQRRLQVGAQLSAPADVPSAPSALRGRG